MNRKDYNSFLDQRFSVVCLVFIIGPKARKNTLIFYIKIKEKNGRKTGKLLRP